MFGRVNSGVEPLPSDEEGSNKPDLLLDTNPLGEKALEPAVSRHKMVAPVYFIYYSVT